MNPIPLIASFGLLCFCLFGPVAWPFAIIPAIAFGWNAGLYYTASRIP